MNCCVAFCLIFFVLPNLIFLFGGAFVTITSLIALVAPSLLLPVYADYFRQMYREVHESMKSSTAEELCYSDQWEASKANSALVIDWQQIPLATHGLLAIAVVGAWFMFWAFWALVALCRCCHKCFLVFSTLVKIALLLALPVGLLLIYVPFKPPIIDQLNTELNRTFERDYYAKPDGSCTPFKLAFDAIQYEIFCCGLDGYAPDTDQRLHYSPVCSAGTVTEETSGQSVQFRNFPGCVDSIKKFLDKQVLLWLGIGVGVVCALLLLEILSGLVVVGLWRREGPSPDGMMHNYLSSERDGFISDKDMEQYYAPGQFSLPSHHHHNQHRRKM